MDDRSALDAVVTADAANSVNDIDAVDAIDAMIGALDISDVVNAIDAGSAKNIADSADAIVAIEETKGIRHFSLPPEIRNTIMYYVLNPGTVFLHPVPGYADEYARKWASAWKATERSEPGYQFLATCKQAYLEGHKIYYQSNKFLLPSGPIEMIKPYFERLKPVHKAMIISVGVNFLFTDLTPEVLKPLMEKVDLATHHGRRFSRSLRFVEEFAEEQLWNLWIPKLTWLCDFDSWEILHIEFSDRKFMYTRAEFLRRMERVKSAGWNQDNRDEMWNIIRNGRELDLDPQDLWRALFIEAHSANEDTWERVRKWLRDWRT